MHAKEVTEVIRRSCLYPSGYGHACSWTRSASWFSGCSFRGYVAQLWARSWGQQSMLICRLWSAVMSYSSGEKRRAAGRINHCIGPLFWGHTTSVAKDSSMLDTVRCCQDTCDSQPDTKSFALALNAQQTAPIISSCAMSPGLRHTWWR